MVLPAVDSSAATVLLGAICLLGMRENGLRSASFHVNVSARHDACVCGATAPTVTCTAACDDTP